MTTCYAYTGKYALITMLIKEAQAITGGESVTSKMPGGSINTHPIACNVGSKLRKVPGSVCEDCYAWKGRYAFDNTQNAMMRRLRALTHYRWVPAMVRLVSRHKVPFFRWDDAGDLQDMSHLIRIVAVAMLTPDVHHWVPTHEYGLMTRYLRAGGHIPANLVIRESAPMVDGAPPTKNGLPTSTVVTDGSATCPAPTQGGECGPCRDCWDPTVQNVAYGKH